MRVDIANFIIVRRIISPGNFYVFWFFDLWFSYIINVRDNKISWHSKLTTDQTIQLNELISTIKI